ncbi:hypothetical protein P43SY_006252 [Pythium insidiosum]|uniref:Glycosylltransferase family 32 protein n=1 Tax=Pythium insidiosum TaxID=114742 RepID=A0AAD5LSG9_PYTIN|nr:hypothetical protein P43SY_006252 [Pythium insidiosum]
MPPPRRRSWLRVVVISLGVLGVIVLLHQMTLMRLMSTSPSLRHDAVPGEHARPADLVDDRKPADSNDDWRRAMQHRPAAAPTPVVVHYTSRTRHPMVEQWKDTCGPLEVRFYDDDASEELVRKHRPEFLETYRTALTPVERADYFRYLVLYVHGGVYADSDVSCLTPVGQWLSTFGWDDYELSDMDFVAGIEFPWAQSQYRVTGPLPLQFNQFLIASTKQSRMMERILKHIEHCIRTVPRNHLEATLERTGPAAFTRAILDEIQRRGIPDPSAAKHPGASDYPPAMLPPDELDKNGQVIPMRADADADGETPFFKVLLLPYRAFAFHRAHNHAAGPVLTEHHFKGSWRIET